MDENDGVSYCLFVALKFDDKSSNKDILTRSFAPLESIEFHVYINL